MDRLSWDPEWEVERLELDSDPADRTGASDQAIDSGDGLEPVGWTEPAPAGSGLVPALAVLGPAAIIAFDLLSAYLERFVPIGVEVTWAATFAVYGAVGYVGARLGRPFAGAYAGLLVGLVDVLVGWRLQMLAGPPGWRPVYDRLSERDVVFASVSWGAIGFAVAAIGAVVGWLALRSRAARIEQASLPAHYRSRYWEEL